MSVLEVFAKAIKSDPEGALALMNEVTYAYLADQAEEVRPELEALLATFVAERTAIAKRAVVKSYVESTVAGKYPDDDIHKSAEWLAGIENYISFSKDLTGSALNEFNRKHPRGAQGRFARGIPQAENLKQSPFGVTPERLSPTVQRAMDFSARSPKIIDEATRPLVERNQYQWDSANRAVESILSNFNTGQRSDVDLILNIQRSTGDLYTKRVPAKNFENALPKNAGWDLEDNLISIEVDSARNASEATRQKVGAYNTLGSIGGNAFAQLANVDAESLSALSTSINRNAGKDKSRLTRFFDRLSAGGSVMQQIDPLKAYGDYARFVGVIGPEAEQALDPYVRQAAYRYRGTEKEPDLALVQQFNSQTLQLVDAVADQRDHENAPAAIENLADRARRGERDRDVDVDMVAASAINNIKRINSTKGFYTADELKMAVRSDVAARFLLNTLPDDPFIAEVSEKSGQILPSQGVIVDADGDIVSQSVGFSDDHYLPFNFKNLASLRGGQYIRTRQQGGLTSEDIYTAVRTGTRRATVVSSSGVFSLEFDPNFRGARANSDKARQMYDRYIKILDAVDQSDLYVLDVTPTEKAKFREMANRLAQGDKKKSDDLFDRYLAGAREAGSNLSEGQAAILEEEARQRVAEERKNMSPDRVARRVEEVYDELATEWSQNRINKLRLNSEGYYKALQTLQQQFPYFIRDVSFQPLTSKSGGFLQGLNQSGAAGARQRLGAGDKGYVSPGGLRSRNVQSGTYASAPAQMRSKGKSEDVAVEAPTTTEAAPKQVAGAPKAVAGVPATQKGGLTKLIDNQSSDSQIEAKTLVDNFVANILGNIVSNARTTTPGIDDETPWNMFDSDKKQTMVLLDIDRIETKALKKAFAEDPQRVLSLMTDKDNVKEAVRVLYNTGKPLGVVDTVEELANAIVQQFKEVQQYTLAQNPFVNPIEGIDGAFYTGSSPQLFPDIVNLVSPDDVMEYIKNNPGVGDAMISIHENTPFDIASNVKKKIDVLKSIPDAYTQLVQQAADEMDPNLVTFNKLASKTGVKPEELLDALGYEDQSSIDPSFMSSINQIQAITMQRADQLQKAWSVLIASKIVEGGGGEGPKVQKAFRNLTPEPSSRQVQVVSKSHPLSLQVQHRKALGLPLVDKKK
ncbi:hypothetical protein UFOVP1264_26 [uncultured Caudovirales phage]|uniref:Uncharacterized protein n=1 Tax=uncultured Caudovirales phage TaxID=2100421 RepID=A0A6J5RLS4_9CAUD|nr:hypothetical protein UFOVP1264_26 [uncultured Caudovirales phage]